ncbi:MAG: hypothetical protein ACLPKI_31045 [Streptosporangiaceae bacterium]
MHFIRTKVFLSLIGAALLAAGVTTVAVAAEHQTSPGSCYSTCPTQTTLSLSTHEVIYGEERRAVFTVTVDPQSGDIGKAPVGTVEIVWRKEVLCTIRLSGGTGSCELQQNELDPGRLPDLVQADYEGNAIFSPSKSPKQYLEIKL